MCHTGHVLSVLEREVYSEAEAARFLRMPQSTLHYWLEGGVFKGHHYEPIIRIEPKGTRSVTWAEFVEAGLLRQYRKKTSRWLSCERSLTDDAQAFLDTTITALEQMPVAERARWPRR